MPGIDYNKIDMEQTQNDFNILFNKKKYLKAIKFIFKLMNTKIITNEVLDEYYHRYHDSIDFSRLIYSEINQYIRKNNTLGYTI